MRLWPAECATCDTPLPIEKEKWEIIALSLNRNPSGLDTVSIRAKCDDCGRDLILDFETGED